MGRDDDGEHIWLRQSARFTVGGQERTVEIALPLRPGATPEEIEQMLAEADAGMERLTHHLDQRITALLSAATEAPTTPARAPVAGPTHPASPPTSQTPQASQQSPAVAAPAAAPAPATPARPAASISEAAATPSPAPAPASASQPPSAAPASERPAPPAAARPAPMPERPTPAPARPTSSPSSPTPAAAAASRPAPAPAAPASAAGDGEPLTRPAFLAETRALGLTPPQVMEHLGVRTLDGLNLREALELLRRQLVRDTAAAPPPRPAAPAPAAPRAAAPPPPPAIEPEPAGTFFDEEDDFDVAFAIPDDEPEDVAEPFVEDGMAGDFAADEAAQPDDLALDDVPDFTAEPTPLSRARSARGQPATRAASTRSQASIAERPTPSASGTMSLPQRARARELLAQLRAASAGGTPSRAQLAAFANVVADQLGAPTAAALARGLFGAVPERLGTDQLNALIQWGKTDPFAEEAPTLLALLREERSAAAAAPSRPASAPSARSSRPAGSRAPGHDAGDGH